MKHRMLHIALTCALAFAILALPLNSSSADGGIITTDPQLWGYIEEGQQMAVIQLGEGKAAQVDLFITMKDNSGQSHEVVFFVPLGDKATDFHVTEESSLDFDIALTNELDKELRAYSTLEANYKGNIRSELFLGTLTTNGLWTWVLASPIFLSSCAGTSAPVPKATYATESSFIAIYAMEEDTNLDALIEMTGLNPGVKEALQDLEGQEIAVITLQTQVAKEETDEWGNRTYEPGQPGIHMNWLTSLTDHPKGASYSYPLGTGQAWASPIELTRIYVVAPKGTDFEVQYPELGADLSGLTGHSPWGGLAARILYRIDTATSPAYAIDQAYGSQGRIWRATYVKSNSSQDLTVIQLPEVSPETRSATRSAQVHVFTTRWTWLYSMLFGATFWLVSWWLIMTRFLKVPYSWKQGKLYQHAFVWSILYPLVTLVLLSIVGLIAVALVSLVLFLSQIYRFSDFSWLINNRASDYILGFLVGLPIFIGITGAVNAFFFSRTKITGVEVTRRRAFGGYMLVVLMANGLYLVYALLYSAIFGAI